MSAADTGFRALAADADLYSGPAYNTYPSLEWISAALAGDKFVMRNYETLDSLFAPEAPFTARSTSLDPNNPADRVLFFDGGW